MTNRNVVKKIMPAFLRPSLLKCLIEGKKNLAANPNPDNITSTFNIVSAIYIVN